MMAPKALSKAMITALGFSILIGIPQLAPFARSARADDKLKERNFYEVLDDVMGDFEYDLKNGNVQGLKDISIRNIVTSENIPPSFKSHLELLITEKVLQDTKAHVIQCLPCRSKKATMNGDNMVISSADTNPEELARIAKVSGISNFMDIAFSYQPSGMVLSMYITDPETGSILWSRSYNSETSRAAAFRRGVDYSQIDQARKENEYVPTIQYRLTLYYMFEPNISAETGTVGLGFRMMERYDNRKKEVGFELISRLDSSVLIGNPAASVPTNLYGGLNITLMFVHAWNLIGEEENFNRPRGSIHLAVGGSYAAGYLGGVVQSGYEWRLGKHSVVNFDIGYKPAAAAFIGSSQAGTVSGLEYGIGIGYLF